MQHNILPNYIDHVVVSRSPDDYVSIEVEIADVFDAWKSSVFSHELLDRTGTIKNEDHLVGDVLKKYVSAKEALARGEALEKPILGVGIYDGVEIGIGREIMVAAYQSGQKSIPVCVRKNQKDEILAIIQLGTKRDCTCSVV